MDKNSGNYYFTLCTGLGLIFGFLFDQMAICICIGVCIGLFLDKQNKNKLD